MPTSPRVSAPFRRLLLFGAALGLATLSCSRDITGPRSSAARVARGLSFQTMFPPVFGSGIGAVANIVPFTHVHIVFTHSDGTVALDTVVDFPAGADSLVLSLTVNLLPNAPATGEPMSLSLDYVNAAGEIVFHGGPVTVLVAPGVQSTAPVTVAVTYTGPGAAAAAVRISPRTRAVSTGDPFEFTAAALDGNGVPIDGTPIVWSSLDPSATIPNAAAGVGTTGSTRGTARIVARLLTGPADTARLVIQPRPAALAAASGDAQTGAADGLLALPVVARVTAADGGGVAGVAVTFAAANGGSVDSTVVTTDSAGHASARWTLGPAAGAQTLTASAAGLAGSPVTFTATATARAASRLAFTTLPAPATAAVPFTVVVAARDSIGNVATGFTGRVTLALGANPGTNTLGGVDTATAVEGTATFAGLTLNKTGKGYTLVASGAGLGPDTSAAFDVVAGPVAACTLLSGGGQTAAVGATLAPITVQAVDGSANGVPVATLHVTVSGGGTVANASPVTDTAGVATINWTLGGTVGTQSLSVACGGSALAITATAVSPTATKVWTGATDTSWTTATNWTPAGVPAATDSVVVPAVGTQPALSAAVTVKSLVVAPGATLSLGANNLTLTGSLDAGTTITSTGGVVQLTGAGTMKGTVTGDVKVTGTYTLSGADTVGGLLTVDTGTLGFGASQLSVTGSFVTQNGGRIVMTQGAARLVVGGNATFTGGDETGQLTLGELEVVGNFTQGATATSFVAAPAFVTRFAGATPTIAFANPTTSKFGKVEFATTTLATMSSNVTVTGDVWLQTATTPAVTSGASDTVFVAGSVYDTTGGRWQVAATAMTGVNGRLPKVMGGNLQFTNANALSDSLAVTGAVVVTGASALLDLNGHSLIVLDSFATAAGGVLRMTSANDSMIVKGSASFNGGSTAGKLTNGYLEVWGGRFTQGTNAQAFAADAPHETNFVDAVPSVILHAITFANPALAGSHFGNLYLGDTLTVLGSDVYANGELETGITITHRVTTTTGDHRLASDGADVRYLTFDNTRWLLQGSDSITSIDYVAFQNTSNTTATQFEWNRPGTGRTYYLTSWAFSTPPTGAGLYMKMTSSAPADTLSMSVNTPVLNGGFIQALGGGVITSWPNAILWVGGVLGDYDTPANWNVYAVPDSTNDVVIPAGDTISLSATSYARNLTVEAGAVLDQGNFDFEVHGNLTTDTLSGGIACAGSDVTGITYQPAGPVATLQGRLCRYHSGRPISQTGLVTVSKVFHVHDSTYTFNGHTVVTPEAWVGTTLGSTGALNMANAADSLIVADSLVVGGNYGASQSAGVSTLTNGVIGVGGSYQVWGAPGAGYFNAATPLKTYLAGQGATIMFTDTTASGFGTLTVDSSHVLATVARVSGNAYLAGGATLSGGAGRLKVGGNFYGGSGSAVTTNAFELAGINSDTGTFSPDTAVYTGSGQTIADSLAAGLGGFNYKSIRVAGSATIAPYGAYGTIYMPGRLTVTGLLRIGSGSPFTLWVGDSLITRGGGVLQMTDANSTLQVAGPALFDGGSTSGRLTAGTLDLQGNFTQAATNSGTSFAARGAHVTKFSATTAQAIAFASPGTGGAGSHFGTLWAANNEPTTGMQLNSNVFVDSTLDLGVGAADSATFTSPGHTLTAAGVNVAGTTTRRLVFDSTLFKLVDGGAYTQFDGVTFRNFGTATPLEVARAAGTYGMTYPLWQYTNWPYAPPAGTYLLSLTGASPNVILTTPAPIATYWSALYWLSTGTGVVTYLP
ncbi:MAG TPA: hypothetical protein VMV51_01820 [Gemmatimonadaceae bacterium]|nr:hypothetical protein [Gemmatimonadaceae bacterium]